MSETQVCHCCFGQGRMPGEGRADCPYCDGTGFVTKEIEEGEDDADHIGDAAQMVPLSQQRLDEIRARAEKARKGRLGWQGAAANYRTDITTLLAEVERLQGEIARYKDWCASKNDAITQMGAEVTRLRQERRWIPVEEMLPEDDASVHIYKTLGIEGCSVLACGYFVGASTPSVQEVNRFRIPRTGIECLDKVAVVLDAWCWGNSFERVTHWMPFPDLPEQPAPDGVGRKEG